MSSSSQASSISPYIIHWGRLWSRPRETDSNRESVARGGIIGGRDGTVDVFGTLLQLWKVVRDGAAAELLSRLRKLAD